jgi:hypothetical protein
VSSIGKYLKVSQETPAEQEGEESGEVEKQPPKKKVRGGFDFSSW